MGRPGLQIRVRNYEKGMVVRMRFIHTGDLHIGKTVNDFSLLEDQRYVLDQLAEAAVHEKADAVVIAGDIYDRAIPPAEAVILLNDFLTRMVRENIPVLLISGNHDSPERLGFGEDILKEKGIYIAGVYRNQLKKVTFTDEYGEVTFVLMPFIKPAAVGAKTSGQAVEKLLCTEKASPMRQVLVTHYFVTSGGKEPELCEAETTVHVGGLDNVEVSLFAGYDYVALGHIHKPQRIGEGQVYYAGAPLAYSFSEAGQVKYMNLVELKEKGRVTVRQIPVKPLHGMRRIKGRLKDLMAGEVIEAADPLDYIQAQLTDEGELIDPIGTLRNVYPNIMQIILTKNEITNSTEYENAVPEKQIGIPELFESFYEIVRGEKPDKRQKSIIGEAAKEAGGEGL